VLWRDLPRPDMDGKEDHGDAHAEHLPKNAHRRHQARGHPVVASLYGPHDGAGVGRGEQAKAEPKHQERGYHEGQARALGQECQHPQTNGGNGHADAGHHTRLHAIRQAPRQGGEYGLYQRLCHQDQAGLSRAQRLDVLQVQAQQEGHGGGGRIAGQRGQAG